MTAWWFLSAGRLLPQLFNKTNASFVKRFIFTVGIVVYIATLGSLQGTHSINSGRN